MGLTLLTQRSDRNLLRLQQDHFIHELWARHTITTGGYDRESGLKVAEETGQLIGYGSLFIANVCLPLGQSFQLTLSWIINR